MLSGRGLCDEQITRPEESYRLSCVVVCDLETSRMGATYIYIDIYIYIYDISRLRVKLDQWVYNEINFNKLHRGEHLIMKVTNEMQLRGI